MVICDEPVSSLGRVYPAQFLNLLKDLQKQPPPSVLNLPVFDLTPTAPSASPTIADASAGMGRRRLVELAPSAGLFSNPLHSLYQALLSAVPMPEPERAARSRRADEGKRRSVGLARAGSATKPSGTSLFWTVDGRPGTSVRVTRPRT